MQYKSLLFLMTFLLSLGVYDQAQSQGLTWEFTKVTRDIHGNETKKIIAYAVNSEITKIEYVKANNPFETFNLLETLKKEHPDAFFNIAPLGSKPMALGACLFSLLDESVRIVYPLPEKYAHKTTNECNYSWSYKIAFVDY